MSVSMDTKTAPIRTAAGKKSAWTQMECMQCRQSHRQTDGQLFIYRCHQTSIRALIKITVKVTEHITWQHHWQLTVSWRMRDKQWHFFTFCMEDGLVWVAVMSTPFAHWTNLGTNFRSWNKVRAIQSIIARFYRLHLARLDEVEVGYHFNYITTWWVYL